MAKKELFEFDDYKVYLRHIEDMRSSIQRGFRSRLAEEIGCQSAFISQVLNTHANLSLEQGIRISRYLDHSEEEEKYFLTLIEFGRAGNPELRVYFERQLEDLREKHLNINNRVKAELALSQEAQSTYYSQWYFAAIHVLVTIPKFRAPHAISTALGLPIDTINKAIIFLLSCGLLSQQRSQLVPGPSQLHLSKESSNLPKHHSNWRIQAIESLAHEDKGDIHYSTVSSLSLTDVKNIRARFVEEIQKYVDTVKPSNEETLYCFNLDFFKLIKS